MNLEAGNSYSEQITFQDVILEGETVSDREFTGCRFQNCVLERCKFIRCRFSDCVFSCCRVSELEFKDTILLDCEFEQCHLTGINWSLLVGGGFMFPIALMKQCHLKYNYFTEMNFLKFNFSQNEILSSLFADCNLSESSFKGCGLEKTEFFRCNMTKADFRESTGYQIDLESCKLKKARFSFPEALNLLNGLGILID